MKLNLLFIVMDVLTLAAYPILFVYGKISAISRTEENDVLANILIPVSVISNR